MYEIFLAVTACFVTPMPIYIVPERSCSGMPGASSQKHASENALARSNRFRQQPVQQVVENEKDDPLSQPLCKSEEINRTYVLSSCSKLSDTPATFKTSDKVTLQSRVASKEPSDANTMHNSGKTQTEKRLVLQRRTRFAWTEASRTNDTSKALVENADSVAQKNATLFQPKASNSDPPLLKTGFQLLKGQTDEERIPDFKKDLLFNQNDSSGTGRCKPWKHRAIVADSQSENNVPNSLLLSIPKPESRTPLLKVTENFCYGKGKGSESIQHKSNKTASLEGWKTPSKSTGERISSMPKCSLAPCIKTPAATFIKNKANYFQTASQKKTNTSRLFLNDKNGKVQENATDAQRASVKVNPQTQSICTKDDSFKVENSKVIVAVRVRPFSIRFVFIQFKNFYVQLP